MAQRMITEQQKRTIIKETRRANRRLERATPGQRRALEYYIRKYTGGAPKFSAATKGLTFQQAAAKINALNKFLSAKSSTRKGWDEIKREQLKKANEKLNQMGYDLSDEELADIIEQVEEGTRSDFYRAVNLVSAAKYDSGGQDLSQEEIADAIAQKKSAQEALQEAIEARQNAKRRREQIQAEEKAARNKLKEKGKKSRKAGPVHTQNKVDYSIKKRK